MKQGSFIKQLSVLGGGVALAQLIPFLFSFAITRVFTSSDFATFGLFLAISGPLSNVVCLRYELAVVLPRADEEAIQLFRFANMAGLAIALFLMLAFLIVHTWIPGFSSPEIFLFLAAFAVFTSFSQAANYWMQRKEWYGKLSLSKVIQNSSVSVITLLLGFYSISHGLLLGYLAGWAVLFSYQRFLLRNIGPSYGLSISRELLYRYKDFPLYNTIPALLQSLTVSLPLWIVVSRYSPHESGSFSMARQLLLALSGTGAVVLSQLYFQRTVKNMHDKKEQLPVFLKTLFTGLIPSFAFLLLLVFFGEPLFAFFFGAPWVFSGKLSGYLGASMVLHVSVYPLSFVLNTLGKTKWLSLWQLMYFLFTTALFLLPYVDILSFSARLLLVDLASYLSLFVFLLLVLRKHDNALPLDN